MTSAFLVLWGEDPMHCRQHR